MLSSTKRCIVGQNFRILKYILCFLFGFITSFLVFQSALQLSERSVATGPKSRKFGPYEIIIAVFSAPQNVDRRNAIRKTWQKLIDRDTKLYYIIGKKQISEDVNAFLIEEEQSYHDILFLPDLTDSYKSLANKLLGTLLHLNKYSFQYLVKVDDDSFVHFPHLKSYLRSLSYKEKLYLGFFDGRATPKKRGQWEEKQWFLCDHYLPYALGGGYVITKDIVSYIASVSKQLALYGSEDVSLGLWMSSLDINRIHEPLFDTEYKSRGCNSRYLITHKQTPTLMEEKYRNIINVNQMCLEDIKWRKSYIYNWNVPPSRCCIRNDSSIP